MASVVKLTAAALSVYGEAGPSCLMFGTDLRHWKSCAHHATRPIELRLHHSAEQHVLSLVQPLLPVNR